MRLLLLALLATSAVAAQDSGFTVVFPPYVTPYLPLSTDAVAVAEAGAFGRTDDPLRMLDNPAVLADFADGVTLSGHVLPEWLGLGGDYRSAGGAIAGGLRTRLGGLPTSVGVGLAYGSFTSPNYATAGVEGEFVPVPPFREDRDQVVALGVGVGVEGPVRVRVGAAGRSLRSVPLLPAPTFIGDAERAHALVADLGVDVTAPVGQWIQGAPSDDGVRAILDVSLGYAVRGLAISGEAPAGYLSTPGHQPSAGVALLVGAEVGARSATPLRVAEAEFLTGAEDPGAAAFGLSAANVFLGSDPSDQALVRRAGRLTLGETLTLSRGSMAGGSLVARDGWGVAVSAGGALRLAGAVAGRPDLSRLGERLDLRYTYAAYTFEPGESPFGGTPTHGLVLRVRP